MLSPEASQSRAERNRWSDKEYLEDHPLHEALKKMLGEVVEANAFESSYNVWDIDCGEDLIRRDRPDRENVPGDGYISFHQGCYEGFLYVDLKELYTRMLNRPGWPGMCRTRIESAYQSDFLENINAVFEQNFTRFDDALQYYNDNANPENMPEPFPGWPSVAQEKADDFAEKFSNAVLEGGDEPMMIKFRIMLKHDQLMAMVMVNFDRPYYRDYVEWLKFYGTPPNCNETLWEDEITLDELTPELLERWKKEMVECV